VLIRDMEEKDLNDVAILYESLIGRKSNMDKFYFISNSGRREWKSCWNCYGHNLSYYGVKF